MSLLRQIALKYGTDKAGHHEYCPIYESYFNRWRHDYFKFVEIGIGGYEFPERGGESLRMWYEYFTRAHIIGVDIYKKDTFIESNRVTITKCSQIDTVSMPDIVKGARIIIDDASHINPMTIRTFEICFPHLASGGIYVVEDAHTSYWETEYLGNPKPGTEGTTMQYFKSLTDAITLDANCSIDSIHFYKEVIVILKK